MAGLGVRMGGPDSTPEESQHLQTHMDASRAAREAVAKFNLPVECVERVLCALLISLYEDFWPGPHVHHKLDFAFAEMKKSTDAGDRCPDPTCERCAAKLSR